MINELLINSETEEIKIKLINEFIHHKKAFWRQPILHYDTTIDSNDIISHFKPHRHEIWYELFYDLIYVAAAGEIGKLAEHDTSSQSLLKCGIIFAVMRDTWDQLMFYQNRFDTKDMIHHLYYLLQAVCALTMACSLTSDNTGHWDVERNLKPFAIAAAISRLCHSFMYGQIFSMTIKYRSHIQTIIITQGISSIIYLLSGFLSLQYHRDIYLLYFLSALVVERLIGKFYLSFIQAAMIPWHIHHLFSREGTFILLILGDCILQLVATTRNTSFHDFLFLFLQFGVVFNIGDIYYQQQIVGKHLFHLTKSKTPSYLWAMLHMFLSLSILYFSGAIKLLNTDYEEEHEHNEHNELSNYQQLSSSITSPHKPSFHDEKYLCFCVTISLLLIYFLRLQHKGLKDEGKLRLRRLSYVFKAIMSLLCAVVPWIANSTTQCIGYLFTITGILILQDLISHEGHIRIEDEHESVKSDNLNDRTTFFDSLKSLLKAAASGSSISNQHHHHHRSNYQHQYQQHSNHYKNTSNHHHHHKSNQNQNNYNFFTQPYSHKYHPIDEVMIEEGENEIEESNFDLNTDKNTEYLSAIQVYHSPNPSPLNTPSEKWNLSNEMNSKSFDFQSYLSTQNQQQNDLQNSTRPILSERSNTMGSYSSPLPSPQNSYSSSHIDQYIDPHLINQTLSTSYQPDTGSIGANYEIQNNNDSNEI